MILYFSGTGNSRYVAEQLVAGTGNSLHFMPKYNPLKIEFEGKQLGIVVPVYSWGISPYVLDFIRDLNSRFIDEAAKHPVWFVLTCGDETAYAPEMMKRSLSEKGIMIAGGWSVIMPNDYVLLPGFDVDSKEVEENKLDECRVRIDYIAGRINERKWEEDYVRGKMCGLKSRIVYPLFKRWGIFPKRWHWTQECIGCGKCVGVCPMGNIDFKSGRPKWGNNCVSCTACFHICPTHAIEYGNATIHKHQYSTLLKRSR